MQNKQKPLKPHNGKGVNHNPDELKKVLKDKKKIIATHQTVIKDVKDTTTGITDTD